MTQARRWLATDFGGPEVLGEIVIELPAPGLGEVTVEVRAAGMNPADYKHFRSGQDPKLLPLSIGNEVAGVILAVGPDAEIASGGGAVGDEVVVFQIFDGYSSALNAPALDVFAKPSRLSFPEAANLLLVGTTAAEALHVIGLSAGETVLVHGAAGGVGTSVVQQARLRGASVIGTASEDDLDAVRGFGATAIRYGPGLEDRVRRLAAGGVDAAVDTGGVDEAAGHLDGRVRPRGAGWISDHRCGQSQQRAVPRRGAQDDPRPGRAGRAQRSDRGHVPTQRHASRG
jgi:NADPH2:quinone reductase